MDRNTWPLVTQICPPSNVGSSSTVETTKLTRSWASENKPCLGKRLELCGQGGQVETEIDEGP